MVRHQAVSVDGTAFIARQPLQVMEEKHAIFVVVEAGGSIDSPLNGVYGHAGDNYPCTSGHTRSTKAANHR
jgi:hypothetical protein